MYIGNFVSAKNDFFDFLMWSCLCELRDLANAGGWKVGVADMNSELANAVYSDVGDDSSIWGFNTNSNCF